MRQEDSFGMQGYVEFLDIVARAYHGLRANGFATRLQYRSEEIGLDGSFPDDAWKWTLEEWETNMREKNVSKVENRNEYRIRQAMVWRDIREHFLSN
ncbi:hypothetical protein NX059_006837 [Plenodomus lindquistii]|nr:hypothetical protein NX059_006837 [Plenodomus lindquistii]